MMTQTTQAPGARLAPAWIARAGWWSNPIILVSILTAVGGVLRFYRLDALSLWVDEGLTVGFGRLPWITVLGLQGAYETHPPLYFVLVKAATVLVPELVAGRLVSAMAGIAAIPLTYALGERLLGGRGGVIAAGLLALAPLHIWYSQEARPYAVAFVLVGLSYLALAWYASSPGVRPAVLYGAAVLLALYTDYSTLYPLVPQGALLLLLTWQQGRRVWPLWAAGGAAVVGFLPWLPQLLDTVHGVGTRQAAYLDVSPERVSTSFLALAGGIGQSSYLWGDELGPWDRLPRLLPLFWLVAAVVGGAGTWALARRSRWAVALPAALLLGTILVAIIISLISAGYAERTILYALLGWTMVPAAALTYTGPRLRPIAITSVGILLGLSLLTLYTIYAVADKQQFRTLADEAQVATMLGLPLYSYPTVTGTLLDAYRPGLPQQVVGDGSPLPLLAPAGSAPPLALWLTYPEVAGIDRLRTDLSAQGYTRLLHQYYWHPLYLDLYARPGPALGTLRPINGDFLAEPNDTVPPRWELPGTGVSWRPGVPAPSRDLMLTNSGPDELRVTQTVPAQPYALYILSLGAQASLQSGRVRAFLICAASDGRFLRMAPDDEGATVPPDSTWQALTIAAVCPLDTKSVVLDLHNAGVGTVAFRTVRLQELVAGP